MTGDSRLKILYSIAILPLNACLGNGKLPSGLFSVKLKIYFAAEA